MAGDCLEWIDLNVADAYVFDPNKAAESVKEWRRLIEAGEMTQRSPQQNKSFHKYLTLLAEAMDDAGYDMRQVIKVPIRPNCNNVKEEMARPVMNKLFPQYKDEDGQVSSTKLETEDMNEFHLIMNRATSESLGISIPWPSLESLSEEQRD